MKTEKKTRKRKIISEGEKENEKKKVKGGQIENYKLLSSGPLKTLDQHLTELFNDPKKEELRLLFEALDQDHEKILMFPQKSFPWLKSRVARLTGSRSPTVAGHSRYQTPIQCLNEMLIILFKEQHDTETNLKKIKQENENNEGNYQNKKKRVMPMDYGSGKESYAQQKFIDMMTCKAVQSFRKQRLNFFLNKSNKNVDHLKKNFREWTFLNQKFPIHESQDVNVDPEVFMVNRGLMVHFYPHRSASPDGFLVINGIPCCGLEIKCSVSRNFALYPSFRHYYYDQISSTLFVLNHYYPTIKTMFFVNWSTKKWTCDPIPFDPDYFFNWYLPRESRFYFDYFLPKMITHIREHIGYNADFQEWVYSYFSFD